MAMASPKVLSGKAQTVPVRVQLKADPARFEVRLGSCAMEHSSRYTAVVGRFRPVVDVLVAVGVAVSTATRDGGSANFAYADYPGGQPPLWLAAGLGLLVGAAVWQR